LEFGFIFGFSVSNNDDEIHRYWAINRNGVYFILSTLTRTNLAAFLKSNQNKIKEFSEIGKLVLQNDEQVNYLTRRITDIVKNYQFDLLDNFIENWRSVNISAQYSGLRFFSPDREKVLEKYHKKKDKIEIIENIVWKND
jgi:hypothetical protein